jgi:hypothetical protein
LDVQFALDVLGAGVLNYLEMLNAQRSPISTRLSARECRAQANQAMAEVNGQLAMAV